MMLLKVIAFMYMRPRISTSICILKRFNLPKPQRCVSTAKIAQTHKETRQVAAVTLAGRRTQRSNLHLNKHEYRLVITGGHAYPLDK